MSVTLLGRWRVWRFHRQLAKLKKLSDALWQTEDPHRARQLIDRFKSSRGYLDGYRYLRQAFEHSNELVRVEVARLGDPRRDMLFTLQLDELLEDPSPLVVEEAARSLIAIAKLEHSGNLYPAIWLLRLIFHAEPITDADLEPIEGGYLPLIAENACLNVTNFAGSAFWWTTERPKAFLPLLMTEVRGSQVRRALVAMLIAARIRDAAGRDYVADFLFHDDNRLRWCDMDRAAGYTLAREMLDKIDPGWRTNYQDRIATLRDHARNSDDPDRRGHADSVLRVLDTVDHRARIHRL